MKNLCALYLAILVSLISSAVSAGAWLREEGDGQGTTSLRFYTTETYFNEDGDKATIPPFTKTELATYFECGLRDCLTIGGEIALAAASNEAPKGK